jgi:DNA-binding response OmpR family regulator
VGRFIETTPVRLISTESDRKMTMNARVVERDDSNEVRQRSRRRRNAFSVPKVLFVDDDPSIIAAMQRNFRSYRIDLLTAFHGCHGVVTALAHTPDLIITDLQMPLATGEELMQCLAHTVRTREVPVIVLTGRPGVVLSRKMRELGAVAVLSKPAQFEDLLGEMSHYIRVEKSRWLPHPSGTNVTNHRSRGRE